MCVTSDVRGLRWRERKSVCVHMTGDVAEGREHKYTVLELDPCPILLIYLHLWPEERTFTFKMRTQMWLFFLFNKSTRQIHICSHVKSYDSALLTVRHKKIQSFKDQHWSHLYKYSAMKNIIWQFPPHKNPVDPWKSHGRSRIRLPHC